MSDQPEAVIEQHGRWWHLVYIRDGLLRHGARDGLGWSVFGARRAERKAQRELVRYARLRQPPTRVIGLDSLPVPPSRTTRGSTPPPDFDG